MNEEIGSLADEVRAAIDGANTVDKLIEVKTRYLGRKGPVATLMKALSSLPPEQRRSAGEAVNKLKQDLLQTLDARIDELSSKDKLEKLSRETLDVTLPGRLIPVGKKHPVTQILDEINDIFLALGFEIAEGPEVESDYYNFEALNIPAEHPAREMWDTFYVGEGTCLRTHTSPVQIRVMEESTPPLRVLAPGTVYRRDSDITHTPMFHQVEGFMVDEHVTFADLKGVLSHFLQRLFGGDTAVRFRPSFFPFTEPSAEVDIGCVICSGSGTGEDGACRICKGSGWLEILGCGMIHPEVFRAVKYDPEKFTGFAFGLGVERIAMLKYGINDIRLFFENDLRFLNQF